MFKNQREFIRHFNDTHREKFNEELFERNDDDIIRELERVIVRCQRNRAFTIKVLNFDVIDDYNEINRLLREYEASNKNRKKSLENKYDYIQIKESDIRLLVIDYYIEVYNTTELDKRNKVLRVYIEIPRVVNKYYFKIGGNMDISMFQVVESTYNNSATNNKNNSSMVANKTMFMASRFFRFNIDRDRNNKMETIDGIKLGGVYFSSIIFTKPVPVMKYLLAKFGIMRTKEMLKTPYIWLSDTQPEDPNKEMYILKRNNIYLYTPRYIYDNDPVTQSLVYTLVLDIDKETTIQNIFTKDYWMERLGRSFGSKVTALEKGYSILESVESICDISSMEHLRLPKEHKKDIYDILVWLIREFSELRLKDNLDISMKRIRWAEYFACIYAYKLTKGIYRISDKGNKVTLQSIEKALNIFPDYLIRTMSKDKLVNPGNMANDLDSVSALKYTYKGVSGLGEDDTSIPGGYRQVHPSHIGRVDLDSSSNSDPGMTGTICPISNMKNGAFSETPEPNDWREKIEELHNNYRELYGKKNVLLFKREVGYNVEDDDINVIEDSLNTMRGLMDPISSLDKDLYGYRNKLFAEV